jgi:hypothetical protein
MRVVRPEVAGGRLGHAGSRTECRLCLERAAGGFVTILDHRSAPMPAQHRPGAGPQRGATCRRGHDLTAEGAIVVYGDVERCALCLQIRRRGQETHARKRAASHANCEKCGVRKFKDTRPLCFGCSTKTAVKERHLSPGEVDAFLSDAQLLESAPLYIKRDPAEHAAWLAWKRAELRNG